VGVNVGVGVLVGVSVGVNVGVKEGFPATIVAKALPKFRGAAGVSTLQANPATRSRAKSAVKTKVAAKRFT